MSLKDFSDVECAVLHGFLTTKVQLSRSFIVMKSISAREREWASKLFFNTHGNKVIHEIALSIYMWNNCDLLQKRETDYLLVLDLLKTLPYPFMETLLRNYQILVKRLYKAGEDLQGFVFTEKSRWAWAARKGQNINGASYTGFKGTDNLGLNDLQEAWCFFNTLEDSTNLNDMMWGNTRWILQYLAPKMGSKLKSFDEQRGVKRDNVRKQYLEGVPEMSVEEEEGVIRVNLNEDELHRQMKSVKAGTKDLHDLVIERAERQLLEKLRVDYKRVSELRISSGESDIPMDSESRPISQEEMLKRIKDRRERIESIRHTHAESDVIDKTVQMSQLSVEDKAELSSLANKKGTYTKPLTEEEKIAEQHNSLMSEDLDFDHPNKISSVTMQELINQLGEEPKHKGSNITGGKDGN